MALLTFLISLAARKANDLVQAVFGWSVTALFGRMRRRAQVLVTGALVLSIVWPIFVIGVVAPHVSAWAIAVVPLHHWIGDTVLRIAWMVLALAAPLLVGLLVRLADPGRKHSLGPALLHGYPIAIGFALAFVVVVVTVPVIKIASLVRRWADEHVYVQAHDGAYDTVLGCLVEACKRAGLEPTISDAPRAMVLATTIMRFFARGAVTTLVGDRLRRVTAKGLELYLYPGDLLTRGRPFEVARVRAMLSRTHLDAHAYLVDSQVAKAMQDQLSEVAKELEADPNPRVPDAVVHRLQAIYRELLRADISYDEWTVLDGMARKLERKLVAPDALPLDQVADAVADGVAGETAQGSDDHLRATAQHAVAVEKSQRAAVVH